MIARNNSYRSASPAWGFGFAAGSLPVRTGFGWRKIRFVSEARLIVFNNITARVAKKHALGFHPFLAALAPHPHEYWPKRMSGANAKPTRRLRCILQQIQIPCTPLFRALHTATSLPDRNETMGTGDTGDTVCFRLVRTAKIRLEVADGLMYKS
jgi:hypothetical protein